MRSFLQCQRALLGYKKIPSNMGQEKYLILILYFLLSHLGELFAFFFQNQEDEISEVIVERFAVFHNYIYLESDVMQHIDPKSCTSMN